MTFHATFNRRQILTAAGAASIGAAMPALAQSDYPSRPIKVIIPLPAGGAADVSVRSMGVEMEKTLKQPILIDNRPGGLFQIGVQAVLSAPADGYTLLFVYSGMLSVQTIHKQFDLTRQFDPITAFGESPTVLAVGPNSKFKTVKDLVDFGRANPGKLNYSNIGPGSVEHLKTYQLTKAAGFDAVAVPYKGGPDAVKALIGGEVDFIITPAFFAGMFVPKGQMNLLAVMDTERLKDFPNVPTIGQAGVDVPPFRFWSGVLVKAGTPAPIVQRLHKEFVASLATPGVIKTQEATGNKPAPSKDPEDLRKLMISEGVWMGDLARQLKLVAN